MLNQSKDWHVLAAAVGSGASHLVTSNGRDFPARSRPAGLTVQKPDPFMLDRFEDDTERVLEAVRLMAGRHRRPVHTPLELAQRMSAGQLLARFGSRLEELLA